MNVLSLVAAFAVSLALIEGFGFFFKAPDQAKNRLFLGISLCIAHWTLCALFGYLSKSTGEAWFWFRLSVPGFTFLHPLMLHLTLYLSGNKSARSPLILLIYLFSALFLFRGLTGILVFETFEKGDPFWIGIPAFTSPWFLFFVAQYIGYYIAAIVILAVWRSRSTSRREKGMAAWIIGSLAGTIILFNTEPFLMPLLTGYRTIMISPNMGVIWLTGIWIAVNRYGLFEPFPGREGVELFLQSRQPVFLVDAKGSIRFANIAARPYLPPDNLPDGRLLILLPRGTQGEPVRFQSSEMKDRFGDHTGWLYIGSPLVDNPSLMEHYRFSDREREILACLVSGLTHKETGALLGITERTVKAHAASIYGKTGTANRMQLIHLIDREKNG
jgi:DNA-binding CsgD family transcriptional regulator